MNPAAPKVLSPLEAAHHLGITPELLTAYCRPAFRRGEDSDVRLSTVTVNGRTRFEMSELDRFDAQLRKPWPSRDGARPPILEAIVAHLRSESRNACARCGGGASVETAHIEPWSTSRSHHPDNLIRLCALCHGSHDRDGLVGTAELQDLKSKLISATRERLARMIDPERGRLPPPRPSRSFFGRGRELEQVIDALRCGSSILIIGTGRIVQQSRLAQAPVGEGRWHSYEV